MSNPFEAFMTGFLNRTSEKVRERKDKAETYFDEQMERARTRGLDSLRQREQAVQSTLGVARTLRDQAGMPEDIVRGLANEGPETLNAAYQLYTNTLGSGVEVDENFWRNVYEFSTEITSESGSLEEFLSQAVGLFPANLEVTQQEGGDPFGAFVASGLGYNAMDRARSRLEQTEMANGYSAADLAAMDGRPQTTRPLGDTGFTEDLAFIADQEAAVKAREDAARASERDQVSGNDRERITTAWNDEVTDTVTALKTEWQNDPNRGDAPEPTNEEYLEMARTEAAIRFYETHSGDRAYLEQFPAIFQYIPQQFFEGNEAPASTIGTPLPAQEGGDLAVPGEALPGTVTTEPIPSEAPVETAPVAADAPIEGQDFNLGSWMLTFQGYTPSGDMRFSGYNPDTGTWSSPVISPEKWRENVSAGRVTNPNTEAAPTPTAATSAQPVVPESGEVNLPETIQAAGQTWTLDGFTGDGQSAIYRSPDGQTTEVTITSIMERIGGFGPGTPPPSMTGESPVTRGVPSQAPAPTRDNKPDVARNPYGEAWSRMDDLLGSMEQGGMNSSDRAGIRSIVEKLASDVIRPSDAIAELTEFSQEFGNAEFVRTLVGQIRAMHPMEPTKGSLGIDGASPEQGVSPSDSAAPARPRGFTERPPKSETSKLTEVAVDSAPNVPVLSIRQAWQAIDKTFEDLSVDTPEQVRNDMWEIMMDLASLEIRPQEAIDQLTRYQEEFGETPLTRRLIAQAQGFISE